MRSRPLTQSLKFLRQIHRVHQQEDEKTRNQLLWSVQEPKAQWQNSKILNREVYSKVRQLVWRRAGYLRSWLCIAGIQCLMNHMFQINYKQNLKVLLLMLNGRPEMLAVPLICEI